MTETDLSWCEGHGLWADETPLAMCPMETQNGMSMVSCQRFLGMGPKTSSVRGNERGNNLLFQRGERARVVRVERRVEKREREASCEGEDIQKRGSEQLELEILISSQR